MIGGLTPKRIEDMRITNTSEYAIRAIVYMAKNPELSYSATELYPYLDAPQKFLAKILQKLAKKKILKSQRGVKGGFKLAVPLENLTLVDIIEAVDGEIALNKCLLTDYDCKREPKCPVHPLWEEAQIKLKEALNRKTIAEIVNDLK
ncbi:MAG: Rrf2 family transcriptional regulator [bacterium]